MDDLVVDNEFAALVGENKDANTATAIVKSVTNASSKAALVEDGQRLLNVASLGDGNNVALIVDVEDTVLLEDGTEHVLDKHGRRRVRDEARLLVQLLGEKVDTDIAVLAGLGRGGDADDLARATLKNQEIANADVVAWDGDGVWNHGASWVGRRILLDARTGKVDITLFDVDFYTLDRSIVSRVMVVVVVMVVQEGWSVDGMANTLGNTLDSSTERMVLTVVVVIAHITLVPWGVDCGTRGCDLLTDLGLTRWKFGGSSSELSGFLTECTSRDSEAVLGGNNGTGTLAVLAFSHVNGSFVGTKSCRNSSKWTELAVVDFVLDVELGVDVSTIRFLISVGEARGGKCQQPVLEESLDWRYDSGYHRPTTTTMGKKISRERKEREERREGKRGVCRSTECTSHGVLTDMPEQPMSPNGLQRGQWGPMGSPRPQWARVSVHGRCLRREKRAAENYLLALRKLDSAGNSVGLRLSLAFVDPDVLLATDAGRGLFLRAEVLPVDAVGDSRREAGFVTFPSDARSLIREVDFSLYLDLFGFRYSVTPIRGREDTEGDRDACVKVQGDGVAAFLLECLSNRSGTGQEEDKKELLGS
jgi:hypothetical protein